MVDEGGLFIGTDDPEELQDGPRGGRREGSALDVDASIKMREVIYSVYLLRKIKITKM
jgi:hypothetical protein